VGDKKKKKKKKKADLSIVLLSICGIRKNVNREGRNVLMGIN
jgi:hypothetical protein